MTAMEEEMAAASEQMKAREEEILAKQTPSVKLVNMVHWKICELSISQKMTCWKKKKKKIEIIKSLRLHLREARLWN